MNPMRTVIRREGQWDVLSPCGHRMPRYGNESTPRRKCTACWVPKSQSKQQKEKAA